MEIKSLGPFGAGGTLSSEREEVVKNLKSQSAFVRATPPEASPQPTQGEVREGLLRMADYLKHFQKKDSNKKKSRKHPFARKGLSLKALTAYTRVSQFEAQEGGKGVYLRREV